MMMRKIVMYPLLIISILLLHGICFAEIISSTELINNAKQYDGKVVSYSGEVVGDVMVRGEYAWINVNDGKNAIGIWIKKELTKNIIYTGSYKAKGDLVEVTGRFNRACTEHGGDLDIHAQSINKIRAGNNTTHTVNKKAINFALVLFCLILLLIYGKRCN
jgi:hypothetical protein